ncbi:MAG: hypothetical protein ABR554_01770 [Pyrinomonadaceae bacterium]
MNEKPAAAKKPTPRGRELNDEVGTMNDELKATSSSYFIVHRSYFIVPPCESLFYRTGLELRRRRVQSS